MTDFTPPRDPNRSTSPHVPRRPLVLAWGNPQRGDDGAAWAMAAAFNERAPDAARVLCCQQLTPELAADVADASAVVLIDAAFDTPGSIHLREISPRAASCPLTHELSPEALLLVSQVLYGRAPAAALVTVGCADCDFGEQLSPAVADAIPRAVGMARDWLASSKAEEILVGLPR